MTAELCADLVAEADAAYSRVVLDPARYTATAREIVDLARRAGNDEALIVGLRALAWTRHAVLDNETAKRLLDSAARLATRRGLHRRLGEVLLTRSVALQELGRYPAATRDLRRAAGLVSPQQRPELLMQLAILDHNAGRVRSAARQYRVVLAEPACPPVIWVKAANNLSYAQTQLGRPQAALAYLDRAASLASELGPMLSAVIENSRAWSSFHAGRFTESLRRFAEAGRLYTAAGLPLGEHYLDYTDALAELRLLDEAATVARLAATDLERHGARLMAAEARLRCARLALALGDIDAARADATSAVRDFRRQRRTAWAAWAVVTAVEADAVADGFTTIAVRRLGHAAATLHRLGLRANAVEAHLVAGRAAVATDDQRRGRRHLAAAGALADGQPLLVRLRGRLALALLADATARPRTTSAYRQKAATRRAAPDAGAVVRHCGAGLADLARHRAALPSVELRVLAAGHGVELGDLGLRHLLRTAPPSRVLHWLERTRAAALLTVQPAAHDDLDDLVIALRTVEQELRAARRERGPLPRTLLARQAALEAQIRRRSWGRDGKTTRSAEIVTAGQLRDLLDGEWLAEFATVDDTIVAVLVGPHRTRRIQLGALSRVEQETVALHFALRRLLRGGRYTDQARSAARTCLDTLAELLIAPLGVPPGAPLVVVPPAKLLRVPWSPLHPGPVCGAPSATMWARSRRAAESRPAGQRVALVAGPNLDGAVAEVQALEARHPRATTLLPPQSTVEAVVAALRQADLAHLACHGHLRSDSPLFSALELSDGPLTVYELHSRAVAPHRVVLAACDSGVERDYEGGEVLGFVSALMAGGTAGVIASGVPLPDGASLALMPRLHDRVVRGESLAGALWAVRAAEPPASPADFVTWCGLTAYGAA
ncbi:CHAT domain-containing tetratricopeptide repeat protein [Verrucosispora sp. FIM060022]|uniref:CHAT domain-containing protein n=1 Tax=Verrucosispora sp. FIM060022 TaxID=1479020 RepID=UPI000F88B849|nr:CHAT domain-containing tetratricopeptide repeat protein [Verrucosispora sp. FIM060022]RUL94557.1 CHAT domain-containing protein [Verrucosispora sp. FIM060022]